MIDQVEEMKKFKKALSRLFTTEDGEIVKKMLKEIYVNQTALVETSQLATGYRLGQKELIQGLIYDAENDNPEFTIKTGE